MTNAAEINSGRQMCHAPSGGGVCHTLVGDRMWLGKVRETDDLSFVISHLSFVIEHRQTTGDGPPVTDDRLESFTGALRDCPKYNCPGFQ